MAVAGAASPSSAAGRSATSGGVPAGVARVLDVPVEPVIAEAEALLAEAG